MIICFYCGSKHVGDTGFDFICMDCNSRWHFHYKKMKYCCDDFKADSEEEGTYYTEGDIEEKPRILRIKYCRYCGEKL